MLPDEPDARLVHLAQRLAEQTRAGRISWSKLAAGRRYLYAGVSGSVTVEKDIDVNGRLLMRVRDQHGVAVDELAATPRVSGLVGAPVDAALANLYDAVTASSETVVDSLLAEIG